MTITFTTWRVSDVNFIMYDTLNPKNLRKERENWEPIKGKLQSFLGGMPFTLTLQEFMFSFSH